MANQMSITRRDEVRRGVIGQFNQASLVDCHDGGWAGFHQNAQSLLCLKTQPPIIDQFRYEQTAADERQRYEGQTKQGFGGIEWTEGSAEHCANNPKSASAQRGKNPAESIMGNK